MRSSAWTVEEFFDKAQAPAPSEIDGEATDAAPPNGA